jgi:competence protein ComEC
MFTWMTAFCAGVIILYCSGFLLPWYAYILCLFLVFCIPCNSRRQTCLLLTLFFILGHFYASYEAKQHIDSILSAEFENIPLHVTGYFCSLPRKGLRSESAEFCASSVIQPISQKAVLGDSRIYLRWPKKLSSTLSDDEAVYRLSVELKRPRGTLNPVGSSYEQYLFQKRVVATGSIFSVFSVDDNVDLSLIKKIEQKIIHSRKGISDYLIDQFVSLEHGGLLKALLLGDRSDITKQDNDILSRTGTQHLMAISGLHIGVVLMLLYRLLPKSKRYIVLVSLLGLIYVALVGFSTSAQRAWVMCVIAIIYLMGFQRPSLWQPFIFGLTIVLLIDPLAPLGMGFWYSFVCVGLLLLCAFMGPKNCATWKLLLVAQLVLLVGLTPINAYFGLPHSLSNSLANLIAIPLVSILVLPCALLSLFVSIFLPEWSMVLFTVLNEVLHLLMTFLSSLENITSQFKVGNSLVLNIGLYLALFFSVLFFRLKALLACFVLSFSLYFYISSNIKAESNQLIVFDAGQGLALGIRSGESMWLYDTGAAYEKSSVAQRAILPYLRANNLIDSTKGIIVSHGDWDHAGGINDLLSETDPSYLWTGEAERLVVQRGYKPTSCIESMNWQLKALKIEVLYPLKVPLSTREKSSNNHSCVVRVTIDGVRFLLMGDLESEAELELVRYYKKALKSDVLIAGHHGSNNASSYALLKHVQPDYVVFSAGYSNRFGHPHKKVIERVEHFTHKIYNTAMAGALIFNIEPSISSRSLSENITVKGIRHGELPFWILKDG